MKLSIPFTSWRSYRKRFLPWIVTNYCFNGGVQAETVKCIEESFLLCQLNNIFQALHADNIQPKTSQQSFYSVTGFVISCKNSHIPNAGTGVFVTKGKISKGQIAALYPGTIYSPSNAIFFQSFANSFIFRCKDSVYIDGKATGISKYIYKSCARRDIVGSYTFCDTSWLTTVPQCVLNIGQYVNNHTAKFPSNVAYQEFDFPCNFPINLRCYIPNIHFKGIQQAASLRAVALVATKDILTGEELLSQYFTVQCG